MPDRVRTDDIQLGKLMLYQLSYGHARVNGHGRAPLWGCQVGPDGGEGTASLRSDTLGGPAPPGDARRARPPMSIRFKLLLGAVSFLLLSVAVFAVTSSVTSDQKSDGVILNLAGRQRMLSERMTKELLSYVESPEDEVWRSFASTKMTFETTHAALRKGGPAPSQFLAAELNDMGEVIPLVGGKLPEGTEVSMLPAASDSVIKDQLDLVASRYAAFVDASAAAEKASRTAKDEGDMLVFQVPQILAQLAVAVTQAQAAGQSELIDDDAKAEWLKIVRYTARQRLVAQHLGTLALNFLRNPNGEEEKAELAAAVELFATTHESLVTGGAVVVDLDDMDSSELLTGGRDPKYQASMLEVTETWKALTGSLGRLQTAGAAKAEALNRALLQSPQIVTAMATIVDRAQTLSERRVATMQTVQIVSLALGALLVLIAALMGNRIGRSVGQAVIVAQTIADGDLTQRCDKIQSRDETGQLLTSLNTMSKELSDLVERVQISGSSVGASSNQIATSTRRQESAVGELAASSTQIAATSTEISATAHELLDTMSHVSEVSNNTAAAAGEGKQCLDEMQQTMDSMVDSAGSITDRLAAINEKTAKISTVVTTIMKIAQQTNLISLNAAIEAENAGELGLGFGVVAKEVRRLADQTSKASKGIAQMVEEMQSAVATAVMGMDGFSEDIRNGTGAVETVTEQLGGIIGQVEALVPQFDAVREGMSAQATGASQIADGVRQIVASSEETAESVRETTSAIDSLSAAAGELQDGVSRFKIGRNGV